MVSKEVFLEKECFQPVDARKPKRIPAESCQCPNKEMASKNKIMPSACLSTDKEHPHSAVYLIKTKI